MNSGSLAPMSQYNNNNYNAFSNAGGLGTPGNGFASRGKASHIKRLSVAPPPTINSIHEDEVDVNPTPRTSRSHLLANLRTAPRQSSGVPNSAPSNQQSFGFENSRVNNANNAYNAYRTAQNMPQTATASNFPGYAGLNQFNNGYVQKQQQQQMYSFPEQVLAPPSINFMDDGDDSVDPQIYDELMATNYYLMQRQQQLQEQLRAVTAAAKQLNINGSQQYSSSPMTQGTSYYNQQFQNGLQPVVTPVPNHPGYLAVFNPMTGQQNIIPDPSYQQLSTSPPVSTPGLINSSPDSEGPGFYSREFKSQTSMSTVKHAFSPPAKSPSPSRGDVEPLPQPSATAYRPGHRKSQSSVQTNVRDNGKVNGPKSAGFPQTPMTGTFGPGMGRAGEHPTRQPRGPPPLEELIAAPTTKHEGSKNFATRQRRQAVSNLVKAGKERRTGRAGSSDSTSTHSDVENGLADVESTGTLSGHSSMGSLRGSATGAIGSEMKGLKQREGSAGRRSNAGSFSSEEGANTDQRKHGSMFAAFSQATEKRRNNFA